MTKMIDRKKLDALKEELKALPPREKSKINSRDAVLEMADQVRALLANNYSIEEVYAKFKDVTESEISLATFRGYLHSKTAARNTADAAKASRKAAKLRKSTKADEVESTGHIVMENAVATDVDQQIVSSGKDIAQSEVSAAAVVAEPGETAHDAISVPQRKPQDLSQGMGEALKERYATPERGTERRDADAASMTENSRRDDPAKDELTPVPGTVS
ncbi:hypothetical protein [Loktanella sp. SALINAS62]|uniref:hypothetical protein n=1 Tax=Loktanella sp. SALINAS62 TaxID=2706124 RepID=UPI001B8B8757|nr:hypothetical protein [Loktanella sp. SALINAS62]MBS1301721.1 hypothetical protein [Loktanella sp. SALINAS62]